GLFLRRHALLNGVTLRVQQGNFDDAVGDVDRFLKDGVENLLLLPFFDNLLPAFEAQLGHLPPKAIAEKESELRERFRFVFEKGKAFRTVFVGLSARLGVSADPSHDVVAETIARFNYVLREEASRCANVRPIDTGDVVAAVGRERAYDQRFYFRGKAPFTPVFLNELARRTVDASRAF